MDRADPARGRLTVLSAHLGPGTGEAAAAAGLERSPVSAAAPVPRAGALSVVDARTGKRHEVKVSEDGTVRATDSKKEMKTDEIVESDMEQKPEPDVNQNHIESDANQEKQTDEVPGSKVNSESVETRKETVTETNANPEKQTDDIQGSEVDSEPVETCQEIVVADVNSEKQADPKATLEVDQKPIETHQETAVETDVVPEKQIVDPGVIYRCRRCRQMVATQEYVVTHKVGQGNGHFGARKKSDVDVDDKKPECSMCIFVEPMKWMKAVEEGYVAHKLYCMGCKALLGQFNWAGMQCTCGTWVIPAFQLTKSKIDECSM